MTQFVFYLCGFDWAFSPTKISFWHQNSPPNLWVGQTGLKTIGRCFWIIPVLFQFLLKKLFKLVVNNLQNKEPPKPSFAVKSKTLGLFKHRTPNTVAFHILCRPQEVL